MATCSRCRGSGSIPESGTRQCGGCGGTGKAYGYGQICMTCGGGGQQSYQQNRTCHVCMGTGTVADPVAPRRNRTKPPRQKKKGGTASNNVTIGGTVHKDAPPEATPRDPVKEGASFFALVTAGFVAWIDYKNPINAEWWGHVLLVFGVFVAVNHIFVKSPTLTLRMTTFTRRAFITGLIFGVLYLIGIMDGGT